MMRMLLVAVAPVATLGGCAETTSISTAGTTIVAHRGASYDAPENTLAAFRLGWERGADAIEGDFYLSADGVIIAHHDKATERTAGVDTPVTAQTLEELRVHDVGSWKDERYAGEQIPTLAEVLETVPPHGSIFIEIKDDTRIVERLAEVLESTALRREQLIVIAFSADVIAAIRHRLPWVDALWLTAGASNNGGQPFRPLHGGYFWPAGLDAGRNPGCGD